MTSSLARLIGLPFALILIFTFSSGGLEIFGIKTILILCSLVVLALLYVFHNQIDAWWWQRHPPRLEKPLKAWLRGYSRYYQKLGPGEIEKIDKRISVFIKIKNFTLKGKRDYQLEEDIKAIVAHEFIRLTLNREDFIFKGFDQIVVYNHPFGSPKIESFHTLELFQEDGVIIFSKEQLVNGFISPDKYVNIALLGAICAFTSLYPRLEYPDVGILKLEEIAENLEFALESFFQTLGVDWINKLDLLIFGFFMYPERTREFYPVACKKLEGIFGNIA